MFPKISFFEYFVLVLHFQLLETVTDLLRLCVTTRKRENSTVLFMCKPGSSQLGTPVPKTLPFRFSVNRLGERPSSSRDLGRHVLTVSDGMRWDEIRADRRVNCEGWGNEEVTWRKKVDRYPSGQN